ncbi:MAG: DUF4920 domain-containing protein [Ahniella sp.]|nr:DUF4920 domain-containing protein [Ahniella sp.]
MKLIALMATMALAAGAQHFGETIPEGQQVSALAPAIAAYQSDDSEPKLYSGRVGKVCQAKGCWLQLIDGDVMARVKSDHKFFVPKDLTGNAQVLGKLVRIELDAEQAEHYAKESNDGSKPGHEFQIKAIAVVVNE